MIADYEVVNAFMREFADTFVFGSAAFVVGLILAAIILFWRRRALHGQLLAASRVIDEAHSIRGPLGLITHVRGAFEGVQIVLSRKGVEADGELIVAASALGIKQFESYLRDGVRNHKACSLVRGAASGTTCPYCKADVATTTTEGTVRCPSCDALHHTGCWQEHGGCSVHGCARVPAGERVNSR
jgi:hypothetical protein